MDEVPVSRTAGLSGFRPCQVRGLWAGRFVKFKRQRCAALGSSPSCLADCGIGSRQFIPFASIWEAVAPGRSNSVCPSSVRSSADTRGRLPQLLQFALLLSLMGGDIRDSFCSGLRAPGRGGYGRVEPLAELVQMDGHR